LLDIIIFVPYNLFKLFWCIKYQYMNIYENRKKKWKKKRNSELTGLGDFGPASAGERAAAWAGGPLGPPAGQTMRGWCGDGAVARAHVPEGGDADGVRRGLNRSGLTAGEVRGGSPSGARFCDGGVATRHGRG
jgi:anti-sigma factor RsiW